MSEKKTPTLAELLRLAKKKGYQGVEVGQGLSVRSPYISPPDILIQPINNEAYRILFKCLSALPDKAGRP